MLRVAGIRSSNRNRRSRSKEAIRATTEYCVGIEKRWVSCNQCGGSRFKALYADELGDEHPTVDYDFRPDTRKTFAIVRCSDCGLVFTNPMPDLRGAYADVVDPVYLASERQRRETARFVLRSIRRHVPDGMRLLDVGCNTGLFLDEAAKFYEVEGVELSRWAARRASLRHKVHTSPISELDLSGQFDVVTLFGVIEHLDDPMRELRAIAGVLKPGGLFVVYTGDVDAWLPRILGKRWWWYQGMHLYYFSSRTLGMLLERAGFEVLSHANHMVYFQLFSLANSLSRYTIGRLFAPILKSQLLKDKMVGLRLSGELLVFARKRT